MKIDTKTIHSVNYNDLDRAISDFLKEKGGKNCEFEVVAYEELCNDTAKTFNIGEYDWAVPDEDEKEEILGGKLHFKTSSILEWMSAEGKIPSGEYVVKISW